MSPTDCTIADRLKGMVIVNKSHGVGKILDVAGNPPFAEIDVNHSSALVTPNSSLSGRVADWVVNEGDSMVWKIQVEQLIDDPNWVTAPRRFRMGQINNFLIENDSTVVLPTTNPRRSHSVKRDMMSHHLRHLESGFRIDDEFLNATYHVISAIDTQFSWFLLKGRERYQDYQDRIENMIDDMSVQCAWQNHILPAVPRESQERVEEILGLFASVNAYYSDNLSVTDAVQLQIQNVEGRIRSYQYIAEEFIRNRIKGGVDTQNGAQQAA